ncbi:AAA family ATPase [Acinetobacter sp. WCHAc060025]|uniref:AAA family ATPase n=1 Tax=Acinetobacter sp. WCHAc060025 TaxID=2518625 RepID=UPI00102378F4|nr:AAA family ATPase [Acinetobacter sp. WCHAc060025]RZG77182.1 ATP-dependent dsDNA exonuclease [Acinetobacter sp. WCHAc060025]
MKILSIRLKNLASLSGEHFIDFESEPLASVGLVAIVGKTGAGKSTILDAMCLALFNKIPRLKDSDGKLTDVDGSELLTNSPLTVLRRGTAHGFAELTFVAQDQKHYLARWELKRSREKSDGKLQSVQRYLKCLTDSVVVADKAKAVDASIHQITQLTFEQFTRAVLLAQSEVTAFLKARDNERGELLEYLTNSSIFAKIGQLAFERTKAVAVKRKELENLLGHIEILSDEQVTELSNQFQMVNAEYQKLDAEKTNLEKQKQWFERKQKFDQEIILKQQAVDKYLQEQQNLAPEHERLTRLEIFSEIRPNVFQQQQLLKAEQELVPQIQQQQSIFNELSAQFEAQKSQYLNAETALAEIQNFENLNLDKINAVRDCNTERDRIVIEFKQIQAKLAELEQTQQPFAQQKQQLEQQIQQIQQQQNHVNEQLLSTQQFVSLDKGLSAHLQQLVQFIQQYQNIENQLGNSVQAEQRLNVQKNELEQAIAQFGNIAQLEQQVEQGRLQRDLKINQRNQLDVIQQKLNQYFDLQSESLQIKEKFNHTTAQLQQTEKSTLIAEQDYQSAKDARLKLQEILQQQRLLHTENIEHLRAELSDGEPCLVCGSTSHPYKVDDSAVSKALFELHQQQEQQATIKEQEALKAWQQSQQHSTKLSAEHEQLKTAIQNNSEKNTLIANALNEQVKVFNIPLDLSLSSAEITQKFQQLIQQNQLDLQHLETQSSQSIENIKQQRQLMQNIQQAEHLLQNAYNLQQQISYLVACLSDAEKEQWQQQTTVQAQHLHAQLKNRLQQIEQFEQLKQQLDQASQELHSTQLNLENTSKQIAETTDNFNMIKVKGQQNTEKANQLILNMTGLSDIKPNEWLAEHDTKRQNSQVHYQQLKQQFDQSRSQYDQQKSRVEQLQAQQQQSQNSLNQVNRDIQNWLSVHADFQVNDLAELTQITPAQEQQIRQNLQNTERLLYEASSVLKTIQAQLAEHALQQPEIDFAQLQQLIAENIETLKAQSEIRDQIKIDLAKHESNVQKQKQFADQIQEVQQEEHRWSKISGLMGDSTGKKFRDYAQQFNLDILLEHANQQLAMLSQRYTLKRLDNSLSLAIIDHDMDGETRSVASLSGGESFLTALALSLAIANMASGSMKIESLFIDEGFGTLDASSLHMVMNALDQLQNQGRKVVLISHIQDMHERIPVQIQVRPLGAGASTIEVVS